MLRTLAEHETLPIELRECVKRSVAVFGNVIKKEAGLTLYNKIEALRARMTSLRGRDEKETLDVLREELIHLEKLNPKDRLIVAQAFTLMLELMNVCENAYRSHRLAEHSRAEHLKRNSEKPINNLPGSNTVIYVLTAHPTEARSPGSIHIFHAIQRTLQNALCGDQSWEECERTLLHELEMGWKISLVRRRIPRVADEADHIYSLLFDKGILNSLLSASAECTPVYIRTWVGGDKDGHPGVDEKVTFESLALSRTHLVKYFEGSLLEVQNTLHVLGSNPTSQSLQSEIGSIIRVLAAARRLAAGDGARIKKLRKSLVSLCQEYEKKMGALHPSLLELKRLLHLFPGLVVPLELRESSDILMASPKPGKKLAIDRMLLELARLSKGGDPRWYSRGFIVSMTGCLEHLLVAESKVRAVFGHAAFPIIPLFEQAKALEDSPKIVQALLRDRRMAQVVRDHWGGTLEIMVGYSDSSKESGVLPSRLSIARGMNLLDQACQNEGITPLFFQGSGGSVDRGGGSIEDQVGWWPRSALKNYKVTIQGEMVERSLSSPEITRGQIERISKSIASALKRPAAPPHLTQLKSFSDRVSQEYRAMIADSGFLEAVAHATPYSDLSELKIGSRPTRRTTEVSVKGLRAIPWVLCWTQTRVLFQTWWGVGTAWRQLDQPGRDALKAAFQEEPVFSSYVRALGFTLGKIELAVWRVYLDRSGLDRDLVERIFSKFQNECSSALEMMMYVTGESDPLWFRPWLGASIRLRSPMIHPLNLLQILAIEDRDFQLFRLSVTGIASGMMTTG